MGLDWEKAFYLNVLRGLKTSGLQLECMQEGVCSISQVKQVEHPKKYKRTSSNFWYMCFTSAAEVTLGACAGTKLGQRYLEAHVSQPLDLMERICISYSHSLAIIFVSGEVHEVRNYYLFVPILSI